MVFVNREHGVLFLHPTKTCGTSIKETLQTLYENENKPQVTELLTQLWDGQIMRNVYFHYDAEAVRNVFPDANDKCYTVIAVRNPYDRIYSLNAYILEKVERYQVSMFWIIFVVVILLIIVSLTTHYMIGLLVWFIVILVSIMLIYRNDGMGFFSYIYLPFNESTKHIKGLMKTHHSLFGSQFSHCKGLRVDRVIYEDDFETQFSEVLDHISGNHVDIKTSNTGASGNGPITKGQLVDGVRYRYIDKYSKESIALINDLYREDFEYFKFKMLNPDTMTHF